MIEEFISIIQSLAQESPLVERCGVICDRQLLTFDNVHEDPANNFMVRAQDVLSILNRQRDDFVIWHTHTLRGYHQLTASDVHMAKFTSQPILMVRADGLHDYYDPTVRLPYVGRTWRTYHRNCYTLLQDWYKENRHVVLPDFYLDDPNEFDGRSPSKFVALADRAGFQVLPITNGEMGAGLRVGDVILTTENENAPGWHCSVVVDVYPEVRCLSQWHDRQSGIFSFRAIRDKIHSVWRYQ